MPIKAPKIARKRIATKRLIELILLTLNWKGENLWGIGREEQAKIFHGLQVLGINGDLWDRVRGLGCNFGEDSNRSSY